MKISINAMKKIKFLISFLLLSVCIQASTILVTNPGTGNDITSNLQTAVNAAVNYDLIEIPTGAFKVNATSISTTKLISFKGQGVGSTILYRDAALSDASILSKPIITLTINSRVPCGVQVYGIEFRSKSPYGASVAQDIGLKVINAVGARVYNCKFSYFGEAGLDWRHYDDDPKGLIDNNIFFHCVKGGSGGLGYGYGIVVYGESSKWIDDVAFGTDNFLFIENNQFYDNRHSVSSAGCALVVIRYNFFQNNNIANYTWQCIDGGHQARELTSGTNRNGTRGAEIYCNKIINSMRTDSSVAMANGCPDDKIQERGIGIMNGDVLCYKDTVIGCRFAFGFIQNESAVYAYPFIQQCGAKSGKREGTSGGNLSGIFANEGDPWVWDMYFPNLYTLTGGGYCQKMWNYTAAVYGGPGVFSDYISPIRDYLYNSGTSGVGAKPLYTPYTYPHPLRSMNNKN
jgi:hypothetical protein